MAAEAVAAAAAGGGGGGGGDVTMMSDDSLSPVRPRALEGDFDEQPSGGGEQGRPLTWGAAVRGASGSPPCPPPAPCSEAGSEWGSIQDEEEGEEMAANEEEPKPVPAAAAAVVSECEGEVASGGGSFDLTEDEEES